MNIFLARGSSLVTRAEWQKKRKKMSGKKERSGRVR